MEDNTDIYYDIIQMIQFKNQMQNAIDFFYMQDPILNKTIISQFKSTISTINNKLMSECPHDYEEDDIDVSPTKTIHINYCRNCLSMFPTQK